MPVRLDQRLAFPDPRHAEKSGSLAGLVAIGGDLSIERLLLAYRSGIFPWSAQPITWWSPDPRGIFELDQFHVARSLERVLKASFLRPRNSTAIHIFSKPIGFEVTIDSAFREVIENCATLRTDGNWISQPFIQAYTKLHEAGYAHSAECWRDGMLVGGIYGVAVGGLFAGESMFHRESNASKSALYFLVQHLRRQGFILFDIQMLTPITRQLGGVEISREEYLQRLEKAIHAPISF